MFYAKIMKISLSLLSYTCNALDSFFPDTVYYRSAIQYVEVDKQMQNRSF